MRTNPGFFLAMAILSSFGGVITLAFTTRPSSSNHQQRLPSFVSQQGQLLSPVVTTRQSSIVLSATPAKKSSSSSSSNNNSNNNNIYDGPALRVVRCFPTLSRRQAEQAVLTGRVKVDGTVVPPSYRLVGGQSLTLDNRKVEWESKAMALLNEKTSTMKTNSKNTKKSSSSTSSPFVYYKYHKPVGVTCTMDKHDRRGLLYSLPPKLVKKKFAKTSKLFPVGRLDLDSEGLVLLTNDGRLADVLLQPRFQHEKEYIVEIKPKLCPEQIDELSKGVVIITVQQRGGQETTKATKPCVVEEVPEYSSSQTTRQALRMILKEGRNRQIRKMIDAVGAEVVSLRRVRHGALSLGKLPSGDILPLRDAELEELLALVAHSNNNRNNNNGDQGGQGGRQRNRSNNGGRGRNRQQGHSSSRGRLQP